MLSETSAIATSNANRLLEKLRQKLDRPGTRWLLVLPGSLLVSAKYGAPCLVYWRDGAWIHRYGDAKIPHAGLGRAAPPAVFTAEARDIFLWEYTPRRGDVVFDVGAGIGAETLVFSRLVSNEGRVVSLEAHPRTYARLTRLCAENDLANVTALQVAAADVDGEVTLSDTAHYLQNTVFDAGNGISVPARRIDTIARELGITHIDLLKMNIEGAERLAISGLDGIVERIRHVCISCHDFLAEDGAPEDMRTKAIVREFLVEHGFRITSREDAPHPWTRDYLYGVNTRTPVA